MKVLCIDVDGRPGDSYGNCDWRPKVNGVYTVWKPFISTMGIYCYSLAEDPDREHFGYAADRFIPLSSIDETEMIREYQTEKA